MSRLFSKPFFSFNSVILLVQEGDNHTLISPFVEDWMYSSTFKNMTGHSPNLYYNITQTEVYCTYHCDKSESYLLYLQIASIGSHQIQLYVSLNETEMCSSNSALTIPSCIPNVIKLTGFNRSLNLDCDMTRIGFQENKSHC